MNNQKMICHTPPTVVTQRNGNYIVSAFGQKVNLKQGIDFDVPAGTKKPGLNKAGAEKIIRLYSFAAETAAQTERKQAMLDGAHLLTMLSDAFCHDAEEEGSAPDANAPLTQKTGSDLINARQARCLFLLGKTVGMSAQKVRDVLLEAGFNSTRMVTQADYEKVCAILKQLR